MREHISYSELKVWNECPHKHKLKYADAINNFLGNEFTVFGTAIHNTCEKALQTGSLETEKYFTLSFLREIESVKTKGVNLDTKLLVEMEKQGKMLSTRVIPTLSDVFGDYEVFSTEEELYLPLGGCDRNFKGYIDLVLKAHGKYHIIDWKSCSWGWGARKKSDKVLNYQLTLYKHFFAKKHQIEPENIETYFALLKRTAKKKQVEVFRVTSGPKKIQNALNLLEKALYNISRENYIKNRTSCDMCEFYKTRHCT
jgi:ATP-dependent exoDNAse (exonuclease V) beta subunit